MNKSIAGLGLLALALVGCGKSRSSANFFGAKPTAASGSLTEQDASELRFYSHVGTDIMLPDGGSEIFWSYAPHQHDSSSLRPLRVSAHQMFSGFLAQRSPYAANGFHRASALLDCAKVTAGALTDGDQDGIPAAVHIEVDCNQSELPKSEWLDSESGSLDVQDKDDQNGVGGYTINADNYKASLTGEDDKGNVVKVDFTGQMHNDQTVAGNQVTTNSDVSFGASTTGVTFAMGRYLQSVVQTEAADENGVTHFTVQDLKGFMQFKGAGTAQGVSRNIDVVLAVTSENLKGDSNCGDSFRSGTVTLADASGNKLVHTYTDCEVKTTYNGKELKHSD